MAALRATWRSTSDFVADVLAFALWPPYYRAQYSSEIADRAEKLLEGPEFVEAVHDLAYFDMSTMLRMPSFRLSLAAMAEAEDDPVIREALAETYRGALGLWKQVYAAVLATRGLRLRPGVTIDDVADILASVNDGLLMRTIGDPDARFIDPVRRRSMLGKAGLAIILGCLERDEAGGGRTLEEAATDLVYERSS